MEEPETADRLAALQGARSKLERAKEHIRYFDRSLRAFFENSPYRTFIETDSDGVQKCKLIVDRPVVLPPNLVCSVGDAIHNLRSVLDHVAYAVAKRNGCEGKWLYNAAFTARKTVVEFNAAITQRVVTEIGDAWVSFLRRIEPYQGGKGADLYTICALDNIDKHRNLLTISTHAVLYGSVRRGSGWGVEEMLAIDLSKSNEVSAWPDDPDRDTPFFVPRITFAEVEGVTDSESNTRRLTKFFNAARWVYANAQKTFFG